MFGLKKIRRNQEHLSWMLANLEVELMGWKEDLVEAIRSNETAVLDAVARIKDMADKLDEALAKGVDEAEMTALVADLREDATILGDAFAPATEPVEEPVEAPVEEPVETPVE